jgi:hypothetical protein
MARFGRRSKSDTPRKPGRVSQFVAVFKMTRKADPAVVWWMLGVFVLTLAVVVGLGMLVSGRWWIFLIIGLPLAFLMSLVIMARRAERAAFDQIADQPGAASAALKGLRRGWNIEQEPVAADPRTQDLIFRAVGRPGVVLVVEGPLPRSARLAEQERKRLSRVLPNVPVHVLHVGDGEGQVPLRKVASTMTRMKPALSKSEVSEVAKRLRALGGIRLPIPKGVDPLRARPDRRATRGR